MPYSDSERKKESDRRYGMEHRKEMNARGRAWREANKERARMHARNWQRKNWWVNHLKMLTGQQIRRANKADQEVT